MGLYYNIALFFSFEEIPETSIEITCIAEIVGLKEEKQYLDKYTVKIIECKDFPKSINKKFIGYIEKGKEYKAGDIVVLKGSIERAEESRNFYGFNNRNYLKQNKIYGMIEIEKVEYIKTEKNLDYVLGKIQKSLKEKIEMLYDEEYKDVVGKILFGMNGSINEEITENFRDAGISHVLAISGLHISYVIFMINFIFEKFIIDLKLRNKLVSSSLILFLLITGASPSCVRACLMSMMYLIAQNIYKKNNIYISIIFVWFVLIFSNMYVVYNVGMWLSFLGTLGIVLFHPILSIIFKSKKENFIYKIIDIILVSLSAQLLIWPVVLYTFNTISLTFFISNVCISVLIGPIIIIGYLSIICSYVFFPLAKIMMIMEEILLKLLFFIADICSKIPFSKIYVTGTNLEIIVVYYIFLCIIIYFFHKNKLKVFKWIIIIKKFFNKKKTNMSEESFEKHIKKFKTIVKEQLNINQFNKKNLLLEDFTTIRLKKGKTFFICLIIIVIMLWYIHIEVFNSNFELYFVDVGQGDCCIIKTENKNIIIDAGEGNSDKYDYGKNVVFQHLLKLGINKIDYMIFSHMDSDHARSD